MPIRRGAEFLESLKDGRRVWVRGEQVDVTTHPRLAGFAHALAGLFDLQHRPENWNLLTMPSPTTGQPVSKSYLEPRTPEDLVCRRQVTEFLCRQSGGMAGRIPDQSGYVLLGLYDVRYLFGEDDPAFAENIANYWAYCREHDVSLTFAFADPSRARDRPETDFEFLHVVEERPDGIIVRGAKVGATLAPYANECFVMTLARPGMAPEEFLWFGIPINTAGVHVICREPLTAQQPEDHPLSSVWDELDAIIVFDDVFIPRERIFYYRREPITDPDRLQGIHAQVLVPPHWHMMTRLTVKAELLTGVCAAITEYLGTAKQPQVQMALGDAVIYVEMLRAMTRAAEANATRSPSGLLLPSFDLVTAGRILAVERMPVLFHMVRELAGAGIVVIPGLADLAHPDLGPHLHRYLVGKDERTRERIRMMKLAWDLTCDSFASRQLLFEMYNGGSLTEHKMRLAGRYDVTPFVQMAKRLAGIESE